MRELISFILIFVKEDYGPLDDFPEAQTLFGAEVGYHLMNIRLHLAGYHRVLHYPLLGRSVLIAGSGFLNILTH